MAEIPLYPLYNSTYTAHRVSPIYHGDKPVLDEEVLQEHARRFCSLIKGDGFHGANLNLHESLDRAGSLQDCTWDLLGDEECWQRLHTEKLGEDNDISTMSVVKVEPDSLRGVHIRLQYERATHSALLLRDPEADEFSIPGFASLPLLLIRMPHPLREALVTYLSTAFDCRISPLRLQSQYLSSALETLLRRIASKTNPALSTSVQLQLTFPSISASLRNLDITVAKDDVAGFIAHGKVLQQFSEHRADTAKGHFVRALEYYLRHHLALDVSHAQVQISKVVCGPLALSRDGKIKIFAPQPVVRLDDSEVDADVSSPELATREIYASLCAYASGESGSLMAMAKARAASTLQGDSNGKRTLLEVDANRASISPSKKRAKTVEPEEDLEIVSVEASARKTRHASVPAEPPPPYELHDPRVVV